MFEFKATLLVVSDFYFPRLERGSGFSVVRESFYSTGGAVFKNCNEPCLT